LALSVTVELARVGVIVVSVRVESRIGDFRSQASSQVSSRADVLAHGSEGYLSLHAHDFVSSID